MGLQLRRQLLFILGGLFFVIGLIGIVLPILPTTPFMILAAGCFAKSSPRFHQALLNNRWIGADLQRWETQRTLLRSTKKRATWVILVMFSLSIALLYERLELQLALAITAIILLFFIWRVAEQSDADRVKSALDYQQIKRLK